MDQGQRRVCLWEGGDEAIADLRVNNNCTGILGPPAKMSSADYIVENKADYGRRHIVDSSTWRDVTDADEDDRYIHVFPGRIGPLAC